jgi:autotransporter-associated beta strand protein
VVYSEVCDTSAAHIMGRRRSKWQPQRRYVVKDTKKARFGSLAVVLGIAAATVAGTAQGATFTWEGSSGTDWGTSGNWAENSAPNNTSADIVFYQSGAGNLTNYTAGTSNYILGRGRTIGSLSFSSDADSDVTINITSTTGSSRILHMGGASITVDSGATGNFTIQGGNTFGLEILNDLTVTHNGTGTLTIASHINQLNNLSEFYSLTKAGTGELVLSYSDNTYRGGTTVSGGMLTMDSAGALGLNTAPLTVDGGTLNMGSQNLTVGNLTGTGGVISGTSSGTRTLTIGNGNNGGGNYQGSIQNGSNGATALTKTGSGKIALSGDNSYTGTTSIDGGTLVIDGSGDINQTSGITIASGASFIYNSSLALTQSITNNSGTIGGTGPIDVAVALDSTSDILAPGNSPGAQTYGVSQSWGSFSYEWETNNFTGTTAGTDFDQIAITGSLDLTGSAPGDYILDVLSLTAGNVSGDVPNFSEVSRTWDVLTTTAGISGFDASYWTIDTSGFTSTPAWTGGWLIAQNGDTLVLSYTPDVIPEPASLALIGLGGLLMFRRRKA